MTVNTNGSKSTVHQPYPEVAHDYGTDEAVLLHKILDEVVRVRESQERTEAMVNDFIQNMAKNPMMKMFAGKFGG